MDFWTSSQRYLRGIGSLAFEGQSSVPHDAPREFWLEHSPLPCVSYFLAQEQLDQKSIRFRSVDDK